MRIRLKHLFRLALAAPIIGCAVGAGVFATADRDVMIVSLKSSLTAATERAPEIDGPVELELWPIPGLRTGNVWIASGDTGGAATVTAETMLVTPSPLGLVMGEVRPWRISFAGARINADAITGLSTDQSANAIAAIDDNIWISAPDAIVNHEGEAYRGDFSFRLSRSAFENALDTSASLTGPDLSLAFDGRIGPTIGVTEVHGTATVTATRAEDLSGIAPDAWTDALTALGATEISADVEKREVGDLMRVRLQSDLNGRNLTGSATLRGAPGWRENGTISVDGSVRSGGVGTLYFAGDAGPEQRFIGTANLSIQDLVTVGEMLNLSPLVARLGAPDGYAEGFVTSGDGRVALTDGRLRFGRNEVAGSITWVAGADPGADLLDLRLTALRPSLIAPGVPLTGDVDGHLSFTLSDASGRGWDAELRSGAVSMAEGIWTGGDLDALVRSGTETPGETVIRDLSVDVVQGEALELELVTLDTDGHRFRGSGVFASGIGDVLLTPATSDANPSAHALRFSGPRDAIVVAAAPIPRTTEAASSSGPGEGGERAEDPGPSETNGGPSVTEGPETTAFDTSTPEPARPETEPTATTVVVNEEAEIQGTLTPGGQVPPTSDSASPPDVSPAPPVVAEVEKAATTDPSNDAAGTSETAAKADANPAPSPVFDPSIPIPPPRPAN